MTTEQESLEVYESGRLTVLGFGGREILDHVSVSECRDTISGLIEKSDCEILAIDLSGVRLIPSGLLGLLTTLRQRGIEVHLYDPSADVIEVLDITKLNQVMTVHHIEA
ncbi:MAG: hypothetical protein CMJ48_13490 [Planctomycetaceae bacterium]|nr:hypothetical protein [Planctomycetaceae bacterium]